MVFSLVRLLQGAAAGSKTAKLFKGAKGVFTILDVGDTVLDSAQLADEIARAIMGDNYSPELRDLAEEVAELGIALDTKMSAIAQANVDIDNLTAGIDSLASIELDFGSRELLVIEQLEKLDQLSVSLNQAAPTVQEWFATLRKSAVNNTPDPDQLAALKKVIDPNMALLLGISGLLGLRAAYTGYRQYKKNQRANFPRILRTDKGSFSVKEAKSKLAASKTRV